MLIYSRKYSLQVISNHSGSVNNPGHLVEYEVIKLLVQHYLVFANEILISPRVFLVGTPRTGSEVIELTGENRECFLGIPWIWLKKNT